MAATSTPTSRFSGLAALSLLLGVASFLLLIITGLPALFLGYYGLRTINQSDGRLKGASLAVAGMVLGGLATLVTVVGLAAWAIVLMRGSSQGTECRNNLRRLGLAMNQFHDDHRAFPPGTVPNDALPPEQRLSWVPLILPYLEIESAPYSKASARRVGKEKELYAQIDFRQAWNAEANRAAASTRLTFCLCPADTVPAARNSAWTTYVGIAGVGRDAGNIPDFHPPNLAPKDPNAGVFGYDRWTTRDDVTANITKTMMLAETTRANGPWAQGGPFTVRGIDPDDNPPIGYRRPFGGLHPHGAYILTVGASVDWVRDDIQPALWQNLARISRENGNAEP